MPRAAAGRARGAGPGLRPKGGKKHIKNKNKRVPCSRCSDHGAGLETPEIGGAGGFPLQAAEKGGVGRKGRVKAPRSAGGGGEGHKSALGRRAGTGGTGTPRR